MWRSLLSLFALCFPATALAQQLVPGDLIFEDNFVTGLNSPTAAEFLPDGRLVITELGGRIRVRPAGGGALINAGQFQVTTTIEKGLLGLAVDPQFATSNRLYFYYSAANGDANNRHRVVHATIDPNTSIVNVAGATMILDGIFGPANHNGGGIKFGPDGYLYIGTGDTGCNCGCAPGSGNNYFPTCLTVLQGKILRIDRDGGIPPTNPLVNVATVASCQNTARPCPSAQPNPNNMQPPRTQIYNWGFRNVWRFSFDEQTGFLWIGDVGEVTFEEITISTGPGQHHGWPFREGANGDPVTACATSTPQSGNCKDPAYQYAHAGGSASVTGGVFSNHCSWPAPWAGRYWFADYDADLRAVWTLTPNAARDGIVAGSRADVLTNAGGVVHFANGPDGAIYMVNINDSVIWRVRPQTPAACPPPADAGPNPDAEPADTGIEPEDAMVADAPPGDGQPEVDTGVPPVDGGPNADATPAPDATGGADANAGLDAAVPGADASVRDGGTGDRPDEGCSCSVAHLSSGGALGLLGLAALLVLRRRRPF